MKMRKAYKQRLKVKHDQQQLFRQQAGCCRFAWHKALALQKECLHAGEKVLNHAAPWWTMVDAHRLEEGRRDDLVSRGAIANPATNHEVSRQGSQGGVRYKEYAAVSPVQEKRPGHRFLSIPARFQAGWGSARLLPGSPPSVGCILDVRIRDMSRSAPATSEAPGKKVLARSRLNRSLLGQGWFEFRRQLEDKLAWNGGWLIRVVPQNTSRTCPVRR